MTVQTTFDAIVNVITTCGPAARDLAIETFVAGAANRARFDPIYGGLLLAFAVTSSGSTDPTIQLLGARLSEALAPLALLALPALEGLFNTSASPEVRAAALLALVAHTHPNALAFVEAAFFQPNEALRLAAIEAVAIYNFNNPNTGQSVFGNFIIGVINDPDCNISLRGLMQDLEFLVGI